MSPSAASDSFSPGDDAPRRSPEPIFEVRKISAADAVVGAVARGIVAWENVGIISWSTRGGSFLIYFLLNFARRHNAVAN